MKKRYFSALALLLLAALLLTGCGAGKGLTREQAYEGVSNYCHSSYDWGPAEENPEIMYVELGEETDTEYLVIFRSYTGALVSFHVEKATGTARITEFVPALGIEEETGTIDLHEYLEEPTAAERRVKK